MHGCKHERLLPRGWSQGTSQILAADDFYGLYLILPFPVNSLLWMCQEMLWWEEGSRLCISHAKLGWVWWGHGDASVLSVVSGQVHKGLRSHTVTSKTDPPPLFAATRLPSLTEDPSVRSVRKPPGHARGCPVLLQV